MIYVTCMATPSCSCVEGLAKVSVYFGNGYWCVKCEVHQLYINIFFGGGGGVRGLFAFCDIETNFISDLSNIVHRVDGVMFLLAFCMVLNLNVIFLYVLWTAKAYLFAYWSTIRCESSVIVAHVLPCLHR
jgi:hypothetical protein